MIALRDAPAALPGPGGERFARGCRHGSLVVEIAAPRWADRQRPHTRDELYVVVAGSGQFECGDRRSAFEPGDALFASAGADHRFVDFTDDRGG